MFSTLRARVCLALALSLLSNGCLESKTGEAFYGRVAVPTKQELRWSDGGLPRVFDPAIAASPPDTDAVRAMFEGLTDYDPRTLEPIPAVALSWEASEGGRVWTFRLRRDARWTNGDPVIAHDFVRSWRRTLQLGERAPHSALLRNIEGARNLTNNNETKPLPDGTEVSGAGERATDEAAAAATFPGREIFGAQAVDEYTLAVRLERPDENFPALVAHPVFRPVHELGAHTDLTIPANGQGESAEELEGTLITNGAFRLSGRAGNGVILERAETYWDAGTVSLERVHFVGTSSAEEALAAYRAGDLDAVTNAAFEPLALKLLAPYEDFRRETFAALTYYQFNTKRAPFNDRRVREALALALDVGRLSADVLGGATVPATSFIPEAGAGNEVGSTASKDDGEGTGKNRLRFDPARAKALLAEAGFPDGENFPVIQLLVNRNEQQRLLAYAVAAMWRSVLNVETNVVTESWEDYETALRAGAFDVVRRSLVMQTVDETTNMLAMFGPELSYTPFTINVPSTEEGAAEGVAVETTGAPDSSERVFANAQVLTEADALKEFPAIPVYFAASYSLVKPYVEGFEPNLLDAPSLKHVRIDTTWATPKKERGILEVE